MNTIIPTSGATGSTVPTVFTESDWSMNAIAPELPDARDLFEVRLRGTKTLILIPKNSMAQELLSDLMEHTPVVGYALRGNAGGHTIRFTEGLLEFKPFPKTPVVAPPKKAHSKRRRPR